MINFLDLFAGAGGLSEGFIEADYSPIAHVEMDPAACNTLRTRTAYYWLKKNGQESIYNAYLEGQMTRDEFYEKIPKKELDKVIQSEISEKTIISIFEKIDSQLQGRPVDLIIGGPPCQAYSIIGRARDEKHMLGDQRNYLYRYYAKFLDHYRPAYFVFENVVGLLSARDENGKRYLDSMIEKFNDCGYTIHYEKIPARKYGILQNRIRIILVGKYVGVEGVKTENEKVLKEERPDFYPILTERPDLEKYTINDLFADLPAIHAGEGKAEPTEVNETRVSPYLHEVKIQDHPGQPVTFHIARPNKEQDLEIYRIAVNDWNNGHERLNYNNLPEKLQSHNNRIAFLDRFKVVAGDEHCAQTICAHLAKDGHYYIHPDINQNRSITPREAARIQTFPDNYYFESISGKPSRTYAYKQIGNAVPVYLAYCIAKAMKKNFENK